MATTSIVIDYGAASAGASLAAELDDTRNGGKTTFLPGESAFFKVFSNVPYTVVSSSGAASKVVAKEVGPADPEVVNFIGLEQPSVSRPIKAITKSTWYGNSYGAISKSGDAGLKASAAAVATVGVAKVEYTTEYDVWKLIPPSSMPSEFAILIVIVAAS